MTLQLQNTYHTHWLGCVAESDVPYFDFIAANQTALEIFFFLFFKNFLCHSKNSAATDLYKFMISMFFDVIVFVFVFVLCGLTELPIN